MEIFHFVSIKSVKKKKWCSADETDGSLENHKYPAKFSSGFTSEADILQVLGQCFTFCTECVDSAMHICIGQPEAIYCLK